MTTPTGDSYPLTFVELSRWNVAQTHPVSCPRHRTPQSMVAGTHESAGHPMWICAECGYATPVLDDEARMTLGATQNFTTAAQAAQLRPDTRLLALPTGPATDHTTGTVAVRARNADPRSAQVASFGAAFAALVIVGYLVGLLPVAPIVPALTALVAAAVAGAVTHDRVRARHHRRYTPTTGAPWTSRAGDLLAGDWIIKPAPSVGGHPWPQPTDEPAAAAITTARAARVIQVARLGVTSQIRLTTTAGTLVPPDLAPVGVVDMADPALTDFTYHPRG